MGDGNTPLPQNQKVPRGGRGGDSDAEGKWVEKRRGPLLGILPPWGVRHLNPHQAWLWLPQSKDQTSTSTREPLRSNHASSTHDLGQVTHLLEP